MLCSHRDLVAPADDPLRFAGATVAERQVVAVLWFVLGVLVGLFGLVMLPLLIAVLGTGLVLWLVIILPLLLAVSILLGILAAAPTIAYALAIAAVLILLWASDRNRRQPR
jgi:hypothetical protein